MTHLEKEGGRQQLVLEDVLARIQHQAEVPQTLWVSQLEGCLAQEDHATLRVTEYRRHTKGSAKNRCHATHPTGESLVELMWNQTIFCTVMREIPEDANFAKRQQETTVRSTPCALELFTCGCDAVA